MNYRPKKRPKRRERETIQAIPLRRLRVAELKRFTAKIKVAGQHGCWVWTGAIKKDTGYPQFKVGGKTVQAHRQSFRHYVGPIPAKHDVHHECRNRACVSPYHLDVLTEGENRADGAINGWWPKAGAETRTCTRCGGSCVERRRGWRCLNCAALIPHKSILPDDHPKAFDADEIEVEVTPKDFVGVGNDSYQEVPF